MSGTQFNADLAAIPADYRDPILNYVEHGVVPENRLLLAILSGDYQWAVEEIDPDLCAVIRFLCRHCPSFAYGSPEHVAKWEFMQRTLHSGSLT